MAATTTVQNVIDRAFEELGVVSTNSVAGLAQAPMIRYVNAAHRKLLNQPEILWDFLAKNYSFDIKADSTLATTATAGSATITITDSSTWPTAGRIILDGEEKDFTANAANVLTLSVPLTASHTEGTLTTLCYAFPSDARKPNELWIKGSVGDGIGLRYNYQDIRMFETLRCSSYDLSTIPNSQRNFFWLNGYIHLPYHTDTRLAILKYTKEPSTLTAASGVGGVLDIPDNEVQLLDYIYESVIARCYKVLKRYDRMGAHMGVAKEILDEVVAEAETKTNKVYNVAPKTSFGGIANLRYRRHYHG